MKKYRYTKIEQVNSINDFLEDIDTVLDSNVGVDINLSGLSSTRKNRELSPAMKGILSGSTAGAGTAGILVAGLGGTALSAGGLTAGTGALGVSSLVGGSAVAGTATAAAVALPVLIVSLPVALTVGAVAGGVFSHIKNRKDKDRLRQELHTYSKALEKQAKITKEYNELRQEYIKLQHENEAKDSIIQNYENKLRKLTMIIKNLLEYIDNLEYDLKLGGILVQ